MSLSEKAFLCANSVILCVSVVKLQKNTLTTEAQRSHREPQRRNLRQTARASDIFNGRFLGFRFAPPQALC